MKCLNKVLLFAVLLAAFSACKKGPDDPFISLRTRKARVVGEWTLKSGNSNYSSNSNNSQFSDNFTYSESAYSETQSSTFNGNTNTTSNSGSHTLKISFKKDGSFSYTETQDGDVFIASGTWNFTSKIGEHKNKEQLVIHITSSAGGNSSTAYTGNSTDITYNIKELRNKKIVLVAESTTSDGSGSDSNKSEMTFEQ